MKRVILVTLLTLLLSHNAHASTIQLPQTGATDGIQSGMAWPSPRFVDNSLANSADQTVTDKLTGLIWTKDANLMKARDPSYDIDKRTWEAANDGAVDWQHALDYVKKLNTESYLGHSDWRLPNINELASLVSRRQYGYDENPSTWLKAQGFSNVQAKNYWSSTTVANYPYSAWIVFLNNGYVLDNFKAYKVNSQEYVDWYVWPVRGQSGSLSSVTLPKTGQTTCYDAKGNPISCSGTGQDGELQTGAAWPSPRFNDNSLEDGAIQTVTDNLTGLAWAKDGNLMITRDPSFDTYGIHGDGDVSYATALSYVDKLNLEFYGGHNDWRLPNINELMSLVNRGKNISKPWLIEQGFTNLQIKNYYTYNGYNFSGQGYCYSGVSCATAWVVNVNTGFVCFGDINYSNQGRSGWVWPVRGGQVGNPAISVSPASKEFGSMPNNSSSGSQTFTISSNGTGTADLLVSGITLTGIDSTMFTLTVGDGTGGSCGVAPTIAPSKSCTVFVTFTPTSIGAKNTTLRIASNDLTKPTLDVAPLSGTAVVSSIYTIGVSVVGGNGSVSCISPVNQGKTSNCTVSPSAGYQLATFTDDGTDKKSSVTGNTYSITNVTGNHSIAATFMAAPKAKVSTKEFPSTQAAYNDILTLNNAVIRLLEGMQTENLTFARNINVILEGGYGESFSGARTATTIEGKLEIRAGKVIVDRVTVN